MFRERSQIASWMRAGGHLAALAGVFGGPALAKPSGAREVDAGERANATGNAYLVPSTAQRQAQLDANLRDQEPVRGWSLFQDSSCGTPSRASSLFASRASRVRPSVAIA